MRQLKIELLRNKMNKKEIVYYIVLITLFLISIYQISEFQFKIEGFWVLMSKTWALIILINLVWSKKELINKAWFTTPKKVNPFL